MIDVAAAGPAELKATLAGVDFIVSVVTATVLGLQRVLFEAAKEAGVKRVIPSDFATTCPPGVRDLHDQVPADAPCSPTPRCFDLTACPLQKLAIRNHIQALGIPYTFIDVGWWMQLAFPSPPAVTADRPLLASLNAVFGSGAKKNALTNLEHVGDYVARVLQDERTINQAVFFWEAEPTAQEIWDAVERTSGDVAAIQAQRRHVRAILCQLPSWLLMGAMGR